MTWRSFAKLSARLLRLGPGETSHLPRHQISKDIENDTVDLGPACDHDISKWQRTSTKTQPN
jgi:hypothetical protein